MLRLIVSILALTPSIAVASQCPDYQEIQNVDFNLDGFPDYFTIDPCNNAGSGYVLYSFMDTDAAKLRVYGEIGNYLGRKYKYVERRSGQYPSLVLSRDNDCPLRLQMTSTTTMGIYDIPCQK